ncbi:hypothetical protein LSAT2_031069 [Lamellibrachia satsuma]|nr:hypothetical protein LSAT2_031069 [Lamellibrachia satsuma]
MTEAYHYEALRKARILQRKREGQMKMSRDAANWQEKLLASQAKAFRDMYRPCRPQMPPQQQHVPPSYHSDGYPCYDGIMDRQSHESRDPQNERYFPPVDRPFESYHSWILGRSGHHSRESIYQYRPATAKEIEHDLMLQARNLYNNNLILGHPSQFKDMLTSGAPRSMKQSIIFIYNVMPDMCDFQEHQ